MNFSEFVCKNKNVGILQCIKKKNIEKIYKEIDRYVSHNVKKRKTGKETTSTSTMTIGNTNDAFSAVVVNRVRLMHRARSFYYLSRIQYHTDCRMYNERMYIR